MRKNIVLMNIMVGLYWMSMYSYVPNLPNYSASLGADAAGIGIIGGVYGVAQIILRIPIGIISDRSGKNRLMMLLGAGILAVSCGILVLAQDAGMLVLGRLTAGAAAAWWVIQSAVYADYFSDEQQVKAQGMLGASTNWGKLIAALAGGLIAQFFGLQMVFVFAFAVAVLCVALTAQIKDIPKKREAKPVAQSLREVTQLLRNRDLWVFSIIGNLTNILCFAGPLYFTAVAAEDLGASKVDIGMLNLVFYLVGAVTSMWVGSRSYKKIGGIHAMAISFAFCGLSCIPAFYHMNIAVLYGMEALAGVCFGITCGALAGMVFRCVPAEQRGTATGIYQSLYGIGIFVGPVLVGSIIKAASFDVSYWVLAVLGVVSALFCWTFIPKKYARM